jgi:predicted nucleotidyltransferase
MTPRFLDFSGKLQPLEDLFRELIRATSAQDIPSFVVGAFARDIIMMAHGIDIKRATEDIDFGIKVKSWEQFQQLKDSLINTKQFKPDKKQQTTYQVSRPCRSRYRAVWLDRERWCDHLARRRDGDDYTRV